MQDIDRRVDRIETDLWRGNGPQHLSITARLANLEEVAKNAKWAFRLTVAVFLTAIATFVATVVKH